MRKYEMMLIYDMEGDSLDAAQSGVKEIFSTNSVSILEEKDMGSRDLAYPINNKLKGRYFLYQVEADESKLVEVKRNFKLQNSLLRYLILAQDN